jgi:beta-lactamase regulating signal transducer with metallopeptidase domain
MSLSGAVLIGVLLSVVRLLKGRLGRQWQYYIWLIVVLRLLLPFGPETSLLGRAYQIADRMMTQAIEGTQETGLSGQDSVRDIAQSVGQNAGTGTDRGDGQYTQQSGGQGAAREELDIAGEKAEESATETVAAVGLPQAAAEADHGDMRLKRGHILPEAAAFAGKYLWVIWLAVAFGMLIRKISMYQGYMKYVKAGAAEVCDIALLDRLAATADQLGVSRTVELCVNPLVASPMLVGYFHPCVVLPRADVPEKEFCWIAMHELTHYKRRDILYKWLVQVTVCLHWFNPLVHWMSREIDRACEFACDEAVVGKMGYDHAADYGETLLNAMAAGGIYREPFATVTMSANKELLRERLGAIMNCKKRKKAMGIIAAGLTVCVALGAFFIGVYPASAREPDQARMPVTDRAEGTFLPEKAEVSKETAWADAERYYEANSLPQFYIAFGELDEQEQEMWLDRIYADGNHPFFSVSVKRLDVESPLVQTFARRFYEDDDVAFFSILADETMMSEETLEGWLDQALSDQKWNFQSMLYDKLNRGEEKDELEKALAEEQREAYRSVGVTWNGKNCYYEGQLVNIFLDIHMPNQSFYTLDMNPAGTVNIRIIRSADGRVTGVAYMTEAEVKELFGDMYGDGEEDSEAATDDREGKTGTRVTETDETETDASDAEFPKKMTVAMPVCRIREGVGADSLVVGLLGEGETVTVLGKKEDADGRMWYLLDQESLPEKPELSVEECYIRGDLLKKK